MTGFFFVCKLQTILGISQPSVSKHLQIPEECGLMGFNKDGQWVNYFLAVGAGIHGFVPEGVMAGFMGKGAWWRGAPMAVKMGIPMYANAAWYNSGGGGFAGERDGAVKCSGLYDECGCPFPAGNSDFV
ncbi:MAG: hypothetical protein K9L30_05500 [Desulfobacterales bacterium]|nr:hypothetical protein [Desulfobacterales bacterium]